MICVAMAVKIVAMSERHDRLRQAREKKYKTAKDAADALGMKTSTYRAHENGQNPFGIDEAQVYGAKFGVDPLWLIGMTGTLTDSKIMPVNVAAQDGPNATITGKVEGYAKLIPVYGQAVGGIDGEFIMNGNILYETMAPPVISEIAGAYAVLVSGDSMSPRYEDGETCFVDPRRRVKKGDYVIAQIQFDESSPPLAYVKRFVRRNSVELVLEQFNPAKELVFPESSVVSVHFIAMSGVS